jgi:hypothetical protein
MQISKELKHWKTSYEFAAILFMARVSSKSVHDKIFRISLFCVFMKKNKNLGQNKRTSQLRCSYTIKSQNKIYDSYPKNMQFSHVATLN